MGTGGTVVPGSPCFSIKRLAPLSEIGTDHEPSELALARAVPHGTYLSCVLVVPHVPTKREILTSLSGIVLARSARAGYKDKEGLHYTTIN